jgi:ddrB-like ParB superfamily domain
MTPPLDATLGAADVDDWITAPAPGAAPAVTPPAREAAAEGPDDWVQAPSSSLDVMADQAGRGTLPQGPAGAFTNAAIQGVVGGVGHAVAGVGRQADAAARAIMQRQLGVIDRLDRGETVPDQDDPLGYQYLSPEQRTTARADLLSQVSERAKAPENVVTRAGTTIEKGAPGWFPVAPETEGHLTNIGRMLGGTGVALGASALGTAVAGPVGGVLGAASVIGAQSYDETYQDAIANGATHEQAEAAAGKAAMAQMGAMSLPIGRVLPLIPVGLREGFLKTVTNLGRRGVELAGANELGTLAQNYVASQTYDPGRSLFKGTGDNAVDSLLTGMIIHAPALVTSRGERVSDTTRPAPSAAEVADRVMGAGSIDEAINAATAAVSGQRAAGAPAGGQPSWGDLFSRGAPADSALFGGTTLTTSGGGKFPYRYEAVDAATLTPASGDLQPRDRAGRMASAGQIVQMANNLDPELLHGSPGPDQGAPTVDANGVVLAGNGRLAAIRQAHAAGHGEAYRSMVERHGFDTTNMAQPVLIRRLMTDLTPEEARQFAVESNVQSGQRLSGTEQAAIDARALTPDLLSLYNPLLQGGPAAAGNRDFVRSWVASLPQSERNAVQDANGVLSADGARRLQGAMLAAGYGDKGVLGRALESTDDTTRGITGALTDAAPAWAQLQARINAGQVPAELNVAPQLIRAVELVRQAREKGQSPADVLAQQDAFNPIDPAAEQFVRAMFNPSMTRQSSRALIAEVLRRYATEAGQASTQAGLFGEALPPVTPADILRTVVAAARGEPMLGPEPTVAEQAAALGVAAPPARVTAAQVQRRDGVGGVEAARRAAAENAAAEVVNGWRRMQPGEPLRPGQEVATDQQGQQWVRADEAAQPTEATGAQVSTRQEAQMAREDFLANRLQGEIERLAAPARRNDGNVYIPNTRQSLAEVSGDPVTVWDHHYNRSQPEAMQRHIDRETWNADQVATYFADTAESAPRIRALERERAERAQRNIQAVFGGPNEQRPPADTTPTLTIMRNLMNDPRQAERGAVNNVITRLAERFYDANGNPKTDPYQLYGIGEHINDLLRGVGNVEESSAARVLQRELTLIKNSLYDDIEGAAPGFARYRAEYERDSRAIDALKYLQDERLSLLNVSRRITPSAWLSFMRRTVEGRADPFNPASSLSEDQMDRLWNITDHLKRQDLLNQSKPAGSWTAFMQEWGGRFAKLAAHAAALHFAPVVGNVGVQLLEHARKQRNVRNEADRLLNPERWPENLRPTNAQPSAW